MMQCNMANGRIEAPIHQVSRWELSDLAQAEENLGEFVNGAVRNG
jgi:hypothetical protein